MSDWLADLNAAYGAATHHAFVVTGNVRDQGNNDVRRRLSMWGEKNFSLTIVWDKATGLVLFGNQELIDIFKKTYLVTDGPFGSQEVPPESVTQSELTFGILSRLLTAQKRVAVIIDYADSALMDDRYSVLQEGDRKAVVTAQIWGRSQVIADNENAVVIISDVLTGVHSAIRAAGAHYKVVRVAYPNHEERLAYITPRTERVTKADLSAREVANLTSGLNYLQIEDIFLAAESEGALTQRLIKRHKDAVISSEFAEVLEPMYPSRGFEIVGGHEIVKQFFRESVIAPLREGDYSRVPMGVLMTGPAGTGKTVMAEAVAYEAQVNAVKLNLAKVFGRYVGDSERNMERAWEGIISMAPTIVFIDEIDQQVRQDRGGGGDSGVSNRVFSRLLEVMSDTSHRGQVVFLAATNRPDLMDPAMKRPGRFDKKVPFFPPTAPREQQLIIDAYVVKYGHPVSSQAAGLMVDSSAGWTGAEIEGLYLKAYEFSRDGSITANNAKAAIAVYLPTTSAIEEMTEVALRECNDLSLVPEMYHDRVRALRAASRT